MQTVTYAVHPAFKRWLLDKMRSASQYMVERATIKLSRDEVVEALIPLENQHILWQASELLRKVRHQSETVDLHFEHTTVQAYIQIDNSYAIHELIIPARLNPVTLGSKLLEYLTPSIFLARDWATLEYVTRELIKLTNDRDMLASLFPWLLDVIHESGWILIPDEKSKLVNFDSPEKQKQWYKDELSITSIVERESCDRTFIAALKRKPRTIAMASSIREATILGLKLFTQYRLAKQQDNKLISKDKDKQSSIIPIINENIMYPTIIKGLEDTKQMYKHEKWK